MSQALVKINLEKKQNSLINKEQECSYKLLLRRIIQDWYLVVLPWSEVHVQLIYIFPQVRAEINTFWDRAKGY